MNPQAQKPTNLLAKLGILFAFVFPPLGLILGIAALNQINKRGENGKGLATAAIIISCSIIVLPIVIIFVSVAITGIR